MDEGDHSDQKTTKDIRLGPDSHRNILCNSTTTPRWKEADEENRQFKAQDGSQKPTKDWPTRNNARGTIHQLEMLPGTMISQTGVKENGDKMGTGPN